MRQIELKEEEREELRGLMRKGKSLREQQRAHCLILSNKGYQIEQLADIFEVERDTISRWFNSWEEFQVEGLKDNPKSGRPPKLTEEESKKVLEFVQENPRQLKIAVEMVREEFKKEVSLDTIKEVLKKVASAGKDAENH